MPFVKITENIFAVGSSSLSGGGDAYSYLIKTKNNSLVLIDCGVDSLKKIERNIKDTGNDPKNLIALILTHCHIDHIGSAYDFKQKYPNIKIYAHEWERDAIAGRKGTEKMIAADWYGVTYKPVKVDVSIKLEEEIIEIGGLKFDFIHTPGHTPGSMSIIVEDDKKKVLFGQDIHGPFMEEFHSNIEDWKRSMKVLLSKEPDILAEGHYGIYKTKEDVAEFIKSHLRSHGGI
ncbi:MAG: MBL fold metallo-hydrolase [Promethearchaeota archaeon]